VYIVRCSDGSYYVGSTTQALENRITEHNAGLYDGYTAARRPVELVFHAEFQSLNDCASAEQQIKGWSRKKKEALIRGDFGSLQFLARRKTKTQTKSSC